MVSLEKNQLIKNKKIAEENKKFIINKLKDYYEIISFNKNTNFLEQATNAFWEAKKGKRLDNLNRLRKKIILNQDRTL